MDGLESQLAYQICLGQGLYYIVTGIWPLLHMKSFLAVTGPKVDLWLVKTVGWLILAIGAGLAAAAIKQELNASLVIIALASALGLAIIEVIYVARKRIAKIYLMDTILELIISTLWLFVAF